MLHNMSRRFLSRLHLWSTDSKTYLQRTFIADTDQMFQRYCTNRKIFGVLFCSVCFSVLADLFPFWSWTHWTESHNLLECLINTHTHNRASEEKKKKIRSLKRRGGWEREARRMIAHLFLMFIMHPYVSLLLHTIKILTTLKKTEQLHKTKSDKRTTMILMHHSVGGYGVTEMSCFNKEAGDQAMKSRSQV